MARLLFKFYFVSINNNGGEQSAVYFKGCLWEAKPDSLDSWTRRWTYI